MVNKILGNISRSLVTGYPKKWYQVFVQVKFAMILIIKTKRLIPFQIVYGMHPRGVYELRNLGKQEMRSVDVEYFSIVVQELHEHWNISNL